MAQNGLKDILQDTSPAPRLYAWTPANLDGSSHNKETGLSETPTRAHRADTEPWGRIYVLGVGNLGRLFASSLVKHPSHPPITLIVHRRELLEHWMTSPGIEMIRAGTIDRTSDFAVEWWTEEKPKAGPILEPAALSSSSGIIRNLVVSTKASDALPQVDRLRRYLDGSSTIAFTQNGMCKMWPPTGSAYIRSRFTNEKENEDGQGPNWVACVTTHGVVSLGPFRSHHVSPATVSVGPVVAQKSLAQRGPQHEYLIKMIAEAPELAGRQVTKPELWVLQLEKLVVNSIINPLTAILRCKNGEIFVNRGDNLPQVMDSLILEASHVLTAFIMHPSSSEILEDTSSHQSESLDKEHLLERFSFPRLRRMVLDIGEKVKENTSSMLQDIWAGKKTEIRDFNGWFIETADFLEQGENVVTHREVMAIVERRQIMSREELSQHLI